MQISNDNMVRTEYNKKIIELIKNKKKNKYQ